MLFNMIGFVNFTLANKYSVLQRKALSIRDIINAIDFTKECLGLLSKSGFTSETVATAVYHAVQLVIMDGLCLGIDVAGNKQKEQIVGHCKVYLADLLSQVFSLSTEFVAALEGELPALTDTETAIGVNPFFIEKKSAVTNKSFAFDAKTTKLNLFKLLRAFTLNKPILIEGPPGVGKTSLVENLARVSGRTLTRINLSEQTDMMDLLGSEYPTVADSS